MYFAKSYLHNLEMLQRVAAHKGNVYMRDTPVTPNRRSNRRYRIDASTSTITDIDCTGTFRLALNYYDCLGLHMAASPQAVRRAYDKVLTSPPDVGYSEETLFYRAVLLRSAVETLSQQDSKKAYDASCNVDVSSEHLPAALVLLQESGDSQLVIELGSSWLSQNRLEPFAEDVAAAVALAHCEEAARVLNADNGTAVLHACRHLETSLQLLRDHRVAAGLQHLIVQTLEDYSPRYCLELLQLPLKDVQQRKRGFGLLRKLAFDLPQEISPIGQDRDGFLATVRACITPQEQLDIYRNLPAGIKQSAYQQLDNALATIALGYKQQNPQMVHGAVTLLRQAQHDAAKGGVNLDLTVEQAACCLLLGDSKQALQLLGLAQGPTEQQQISTYDSIKKFVLVMEHSRDESDLLPGVYVLTQTWVQEAVVGGFRAESFADLSNPSDLRLWFDAKQVQMYIQALAVIRNIRLLALLQGLPAAVAAFVGWVVQGLLQVLANGNSSSSMHHSSTKLVSSVDASMVAGTEQLAFNRHGPAAPAATRSPGHGIRSPTPANEAAVSPLQRTASVEPLPIWQTESPELEDGVHGRWPSRHRLISDDCGKDAPSPTAVEPGLCLQLQDLEMQMWDAYPSEHGTIGSWVLKLQRGLPAVLLGVIVAMAYASARTERAEHSMPSPAALWESARC